MMGSTISKREAVQERFEAYVEEIRERFEAYVDDVLSGRILACAKTKKAMIRHRREMEKAANGWRYVMDWRRAARVLWFM